MEPICRPRLEQQATGVGRVVIHGRSRGVGIHGRCGDVVIHGSRCSRHCRHVVGHGRCHLRSVCAILAAALEEEGQKCHQDSKSNCANGHHGWSNTRDATQKSLVGLGAIVQQNATHVRRHGA